jgi:hypothetical protein
MVGKKMGNLIDALEVTLDRCGNRHNMCADCPHIAACVEIWDKASEQSVIKPLTHEQLTNYIDKFDHFWASESDAVPTSS